MSYPEEIWIYREIKYIVHKEYDGVDVERPGSTKYVRSDTAQKRENDLKKRIDELVCELDLLVNSDTNHGT
jgi:hypothetical protein